MRRSLPTGTVTFFVAGILTVATIVALKIRPVALIPLSSEKSDRPWATPATFEIFESGWDDVAYTQWLDAKSTLVAAVLSSTENVLEYATNPLGTVRAHSHESIPGGNWLRKQLDGQPTWERSTFKTFLTFVPGHAHYVDFGTWIGPTLLYASQLVQSSFGVEADPVAFASVSTTVLLNRGKSWGDHISLQPAAVGLGSSDNPVPVKVTMQSAKAGNSCSGIGSWTANCGEVSARWQVNSYTLPALMKNWRVTASETFIKVDVESHECKLVPSWIPWLQLLRKKPTFFISFHSYVAKCSEEEYDAIMHFSLLFKRVIVESKGDVGFKAFDVRGSSASWLSGSTVIFTDR